MKIEIVERLSTPNKKHIKIETDKGDSIRIEILDGETCVQALVTSVDSLPFVQPKASNQLLIHFQY